MRAARLAREARKPNWAKLRKALRPELEQKRDDALTLLGDGVSAVDLHDGRVAELVVPARSFMDHGARLLERAPWVRHLHITDYREVGPSLFEASVFRGIQSLGLVRQGLTDDDIVVMAQSPHIGSLRWLDLSGNRLTGRAHETIACSSSLARLAYLGLDDNASPSPVDRASSDVFDGAIVETWTTEAGRSLERKARRRLAWLHAPERFSRSYPPTPLDVATAQ
ncbi:MAG: hypothetical protein AAGF11_51355 [Myxococcota bacterium]